ASSGPVDTSTAGTEMGVVGAGASVSQFHWAVSASGGLSSVATLPFVPFVGATAVAAGEDVVVSAGAGVPDIAELMLVWTPVTADLVSSTTARVSFSSAWIVRLNSSLNSLVARRKSPIALPT